MIFERNFGYFLIIAAIGVIGAVFLSLISPLALILAATMIAAGLGFIRQVRQEIELINQSDQQRNSS